MTIIADRPGLLGTFDLPTGSRASFEEVVIRLPNPSVECPIERAMVDMQFRRDAVGEFSTAVPFDEPRRRLTSAQRSIDTLPPATLYCVGTFRVYFNRHGAAPLVWCVARMVQEEGVEVVAWEIAVQSVTISNHCETVYEPKAVPDDEDGRPSAWFRTEGRLRVDAAGKARIGEP